MPNPTTNLTEIVRVATILEALVEEVRALAEKVEELKDDRVVVTEHKLAVMEERIVRNSARMDTMEANCAWLLKTVIAEGLTILGGLLLWAVKTYFV